MIQHELWYVTNTVVIIHTDVEFITQISIFLIPKEYRQTYCPYCKYGKLPTNVCNINNCWQWCLTRSLRHRFIFTFHYCVTSCFKPRPIPDIVAARGVLNPTARRRLKSFFWRQIRQNWRLFSWLWLTMSWFT